MGAIFGMVGEGSLDEVEAMGERVAHRGEFQRVWSPAPGVILGQSREVAHRLWSVLSLECWARHFLSTRHGASSQTPAGSD